MIGIGVKPVRIFGYLCPPEIAHCEEVIIKKIETLKN
jgi:hypothetical protein